MINPKDIEQASRYHFSSDYIFHGMYVTVDAFLKDNFNTGYHYQDFFEIHLITRGSGFHVIGEEVLEARVGDLFIVPPMLKHAFVEGRELDVFHFMISPRFIEKNLSRLSSIPSFVSLFEMYPLLREQGGRYSVFHLSLAEQEGLVALLKLLSGACKFTEADMHYCESLAFSILYQICSFKKEESAPEEDGLFSKSLEMILERYRENLTIDELASVAGLSRTAYIKKFKNSTGMSPRQLIVMERLKIAKTLLSTTDMPINRIAEESGFYDTSHFIKTFTKAEKTSPTDYRVQSNLRYALRHEVIIEE